MLGAEQDIQADYTYDTSLVEAFLVPAGTVIEVYATTLHYAPCTADGESGFRCVVVLPAGTNTDLTFPAGEKDGEERLITAKNKWLIADEEAGIEGAFCGLSGRISKFNSCVFEKTGKPIRVRKPIRIRKSIRKTIRKEVLQ